MSTFHKTEVYTEMGMAKLGIGVRIEFAQVDSVLREFDVSAERELFLAGHGVGVISVERGCPYVVCTGRGNPRHRFRHLHSGQSCQ